MEIAKCNICSRGVSEIGRIYYEVWEKKKDDFGLGRKEKIFCQNCWKEKEKDYRNYPCHTEEVKKRITKMEIREKTSTGFFMMGTTYIMTPPKKSGYMKKN